MRIYTRGGDDGTTALRGGSRVAKDAARIEAYGTLDELNAALGCVRAASPAPELDRILERLQGELFVLGAELSTPPGGAPAGGEGTIGAAQVAALEAEIDGLEAGLAPLRSFILPGGSPPAAALHFARTVCRRAERRVRTLAGEEPVRPELLAYLNRLSDHLFVLARAANRGSGVSDTPWRPRA